ncbi:MAG: hypothetical protein QY314_01140 [Candidatus Dojkabacteria bacterium]|nr:MAG: hypothetical protein QY314_01140 [Candidatus Dojkabacteria bacterium]
MSIFPFVNSVEFIVIFCVVFVVAGLAVLFGFLYEPFYHRKHDEIRARYRSISQSDPHIALLNRQKDRIFLVVEWAAVVLFALSTFVAVAFFSFRFESLFWVTIPYMAIAIASFLFARHLREDRIRRFYTFTRVETVFFFGSLAVISVYVVLFIIGVIAAILDYHQLL